MALMEAAGWTAGVHGSYLGTLDTWCDCNAAPASRAGANAARRTVRLVRAQRRYADLCVFPPEETSSGECIAREVRSRRGSGSVPAPPPRRRPGERGSIFRAAGASSTHATWSGGETSSGEFVARATCCYDGRARNRRFKFGISSEGSFQDEREEKQHLRFRR